jgi:hypothetical protein
LELDEAEKKAVEYVAKKSGADPSSIKVHGAEHESGGWLAVTGAFTEKKGKPAGFGALARYTQYFKVSFNPNGDIVGWKISDRPID